MSTQKPASRCTRSATALIEGASQRLTQWLLSDQVLRPARVGAGVANYLSSYGVYNALYPEIAGYYLQFLSLLDNPGDIACIAAARVIAWLEDIGPQGDPQTLYFLDPTDADWRNECLFAFDLSMILRGFAKAEARWPGIVPASLNARYVISIRALVMGDRVRSHRERRGTPAHPIPDKWSTNIEVHHVKIAASLAALDRRYSIDVSGTLREQADALRIEGVARMRELHPFLYLIEGWLMLWGSSCDQSFLRLASGAFTILLGQMTPDAGILPPISGRHDMPTRCDVWAQALRVGVILESAGALNNSAAAVWRCGRDVLLRALLARMTAEGAVEFDDVGRHRNVWASLFAWQALRFELQSRAGTLDPAAAANSLI